MNLGLRDAVVLAPVIVEHLKRIAGVTDAAQLKAADDATLEAWATDRHAKALKVISLAKTAFQLFTLKDETTWYLGVIPVNWVKVRNFMMSLASWTGMNRSQMRRLSGLQNR